MNPPTTFSIFVDSINADNAPKHKSYIVASGNKQISSADLQFREYASQIEKALTGQGFTKVSNPEDAEIVVALTYGISNPKESTASYSLPVFGQTGIASSTTYGQISPQGSFSGTTYNTPSFGVTGYMPVSENFTTYTRHFVAIAFDVAASKEKGQDVQLWKTTVTSTGSSGDLRYVFPYMVYAARSYLGKNTGKKIEVGLSSDSPDVAAYRSGTQLQTENAGK